MTSANINIRTDIKTKNEAEQLFEELGLNMTTAINMFLKQAIREKKIPFEIRLDIPNTETVKAFEEGQRIAKDKSVKAYSSIDELINALESEIAD